MRRKRNRDRDRLKRNDCGPGIKWDSEAVYRKILPYTTGFARETLLNKMRDRGVELMFGNKDAKIIELPVDSEKIIKEDKKSNRETEVHTTTRPAAIFDGFDYAPQKIAEEEIAEDFDIHSTELERILGKGDSSMRKFLDVFNYFDNEGYLMADKRKVRERHSDIRDLTRKFLENGKTAVREGRLTPEFYSLVGSKINDYLVSAEIEVEKEKWASDEISEAERILAGKDVKYWKIEDRINALEGYISECDVEGRHDEVRALGDKFFSGESLRNAIAKGRVKAEKVADLRNKFDNYLRVQENRKEYEVNDVYESDMPKNIYSLKNARTERYGMNGASKYFERVIETTNKLFVRFGKVVGLF